MSHSITQLGNEVLARLLNAKSEAGNEVHFTSEPLYLNMGNTTTCSRYVHNQYSDESGEVVLIWGMELGLRALEKATEGESLFDGICKCVRNNGMLIPSHVIVHMWDRSHEDAQ